VVKLLRVYGGCLGVQSRRRTWSAAIISGEPPTGFDPEVSKIGKPLRIYLLRLPAQLAGRGNVGN